MGWRVARLDEIPRSDEIPYDGRWRAAAERWPDSQRQAHAVRRFLGITSFGVNSFEAPAGDLLVIPHDETAYGQEELYLVVRGRARFICNGEEFELGEGEMLYATPEVHREATALETPTVLLLVGGLPGQPYAPPAWSIDTPVQ